MTATVGEVITEVTATLEETVTISGLSTRDIVGEYVPPKTGDPDPEYTGTVDLDPLDAITQQIQKICLNGLCMSRQEKLAKEKEMAVGIHTITSQKAAGDILEKMRCPRLRDHQAFGPCK